MARSQRQAGESALYPGLVPPERSRGVPHTSQGLPATSTNLILQSKHHPASSVRHQNLCCVRERTQYWHPENLRRESQGIKHQHTTGKFTLAKLQQLAAPRASLLPCKVLLEDDVFLCLWDCTPDLSSLPAGEKEPCPFQWCACSLRFTSGLLKCC